MTVYPPKNWAKSVKTCKSKYLLIKTAESNSKSGMATFKHDLIMATQELSQGIGVVFGGDLSHLIEVKRMLLNSIPIILIAGSGGICDFIRFGLGRVSYYTVDVP